MFQITERSVVVLASELVLCVQLVWWMKTTEEMLVLCSSTSARRHLKVHSEVLTKRRLLNVLI